MNHGTGKSAEMWKPEKPTSFVVGSEGPLISIRISRELVQDIRSFMEPAEARRFRNALSVAIRAAERVAEASNTSETEESK